MAMVVNHFWPANSPWHVVQDTLRSSKSLSNSFRLSTFAAGGGSEDRLQGAPSNHGITSTVWLLVDPTLTTIRITRNSWWFTMNYGGLIHRISHWFLSVDDWWLMKQIETISDIHRPAMQPKGRVVSNPNKRREISTVPLSTCDVFAVWTSNARDVRSTWINRTLFSRDWCMKQKYQGTMKKTLHHPAPVPILPKYPGKHHEWTEKCIDSSQLKRNTKHLRHIF